MMSILLTIKNKRLYTQSNEANKPRLASPDRRFLHLLPKVLLTGGELEMLGRHRAELSVSSSALGKAIRPSSKIIVRRPYPNRRYLVGGSKTTALGWLVELPPALSMVDARFSWAIPLFNADLEEDFIHFIEHEFELRLEGTAGEKTSDVFTMDHLPWPDLNKWLGGQTLMNVTPYGRIGGIDLQLARNLKVTVSKRVEPEDTTHIVEKMLLPAVSLESFRNFQALGGS